VETADAVTEDATLKWSILRPGVLEVRADLSFQPRPGTVLYYVRFETPVLKEAVAKNFFLPVVTAYAQCCPLPGPDDTVAVFIDGLCEKIVRRRADVEMAPASPNPARGQTAFNFTVREREHFSSAHAVLTLFNTKGEPVDDIYSGEIRPGKYSIPYSLEGLPAGTYYYVLRTGSVAQTRALVVVR
jgi:hypothetical protein